MSVDLEGLAPRLRPSIRADCLRGGSNEGRPCPWVSCKWHLYLDVTPVGSIRIPLADREPWELVETCTLDVADRGGQSLQDVGELLGLTRERVRQVEQMALAKAEARLLETEGVSGWSKAAHLGERVLEAMVPFRAVSTTMLAKRLGMLMSDVYAGLFVLQGQKKIRRVSGPAKGGLWTRVVK